MPDKTPTTDIEQWQKAMLAWRADVSKRIAHMERRLRVVGVVVIATLLGLGWAGQRIVSEKSAGDRTDRQQFAQLSEFAKTQQRERVRNVRDACTAQNQRHDDTIRTLDRLLLSRLEGRRVSTSVPAREVRRRLRAGMKRLEADQRAQIEQSRAFTVLLINALAPRRDCKAVVKQQTGASSAQTP